MPERTLTVATYAAGASLAAVALIYVFGPTFTLDSDQSSTSGGVFNSRKKGIVGLANSANDCFINSVLQALAGLNDLRLYLIQETHRRKIDDRWVYSQVAPIDTSSSDGSAPQSRKPMPEWKTEGLQMGIVTKGLKEILDALNERPIYKKTISAGPFLRTLEIAFQQRISRQQQDAQEFLQVVAERLCDEYHAGKRARNLARGKAAPTRQAAAPSSVGLQQEGNEVELNGVDNAEDSSVQGGIGPAMSPAPATTPSSSLEAAEAEDGDAGFPLEGKYESQIECTVCGFKPRPTESTFCSLTLNVPQTSATTLGACFDGMFKTEIIDDFKCEKCRLVHALELLQKKSATLPESSREEGRAAIEKLLEAIDTDPEQPPQGVELPDPRLAPKRRIKRHIRLTVFPRILAIHLSRSIFDASNLSQKNSAKVSFPEHLPLGGLLSQKRYKLRGLVTHKGSHHSGHYETFRRQDVPSPFSNPNTFQPSGVYCKTVSVASTPQVGAALQEIEESSPLTSEADLASPASESKSTPSPSPSSLSRDTASEFEIGTSGLSLNPNEPRLRRGICTDSSSQRSAPVSVVSTRPPGPSVGTGGPVTGSGDPQVVSSTPAVPTKRKKPLNRWWRISDEKVKQASTGDVMGMQREVYLLFYELDRER
ncbi:hypothetical protein OQA88_11689 [Cercophora sp. LCS_1]